MCVREKEVLTVLFNLVTGLINKPAVERERERENNEVMKWSKVEMVQQRSAVSHTCCRVCVVCQQKSEEREAWKPCEVVPTPD